MASPGREECGLNTQVAILGSLVVFLVALITRTGVCVSRNATFFSVCMCEFDQHLTSVAVFVFREEKSGS